MANRWAALAVVFVTRSTMGFQFQSIASVAPLLVTDLSLSYAEVGLLIGLYMLPGALFALPGGLLGRRFGDRRTVVAGLVLMVVGGVLTAASGGFFTAAAGRVLSGVGAVVMNILLAKMVADWFAGRETQTAMAVMLTSWPVGLGVAAATLGALGAATGWRMVTGITAAAAAAGVVLMLTLYRNAPAAGAPAATAARARLSRRDLLLAISAGAAWSCFNAALVAVIAFGPGLLIARGTSIGDAGAVVSLAIWVTIISVPLGGLLADRWRRPNLMIVGGSLVAAALTLLLPVFPHPALGLCLLGVAIGPPPGPAMSLVPRALAPERLAVGLGVFYTVFYVGMAVTQPIAGLLRDLSGNPAMPIVFAAGVMAATVVGLGVFRVLERRAR